MSESRGHSGVPMNARAKSTPSAPARIANIDTVVGVHVVGGLEGAWTVRATAMTSSGTEAHHGHEGKITGGQSSLVCMSSSAGGEASPCAIRVKDTTPRAALAPQYVTWAKRTEAKTDQSNHVLGCRWRRLTTLHRSEREMAPGEAAREGPS